MGSQLQLKELKWYIYLTIYFTCKTDSNSNKNKGTEYEFLEDWGEQLTGKSQPVICIYNVDWEPFYSEDAVQIFEGCGKWSPGQVKYIFIAFKNVIFISFISWLGALINICTVSHGFIDQEDWELFIALIVQAKFLSLILRPANMVLSPKYLFVPFILNIIISRMVRAENQHSCITSL